jgi:HAD superfamily hydrolase (TIGR01549 family)
MYKALFLDMDETLCDTTLANNTATSMLADALNRDFGDQIDEQSFAEHFLKGIYKVWTPEQAERYRPLRAERGELVYRQELTKDLFEAQGLVVDVEYASRLHEQFEVDRMAAFDFFPGIQAFLQAAREQFTLVVITNGPEFSQVPKLKTVNMDHFVDHIIIGGQEPEEKPARSIFDKAMRLADCQAHEAIHFGDSLTADIVGANRSDITSVWIRHGQDEQENIIPVHTLDHPEEIPGFVSRL